MKAMLALEVIGDGHLDPLKRATHILNYMSPGLGTVLVGPTSGSRPWVAEILGRDPVYSFARKFLPCHIDYRHANSVGTRGVLMHCVLESGKLYEVKERVSWKKTVRYFCTVTEDGDIVEITRQRVDAWLNARLASTS